MDFNKIKDINKQKQDKQKKYQEEQDYQKKRQLFLQIQPTLHSGLVGSLNRSLWRMRVQILWVDFQ